MNLPLPAAERLFEVVVVAKKLKIPPAEAWWCPVVFVVGVVGKLKYHRLKPVVSNTSLRSD
jgi:hypothetical protein